MDLPTYTSIWRIEKRLYKLYDFRLPMPVPVGQIAVFAAITVPYVILLTILGLPFNHTLFWLYVLPPGVITWLATRPVLESKRLPELVISQVRYLGEPGTWCRMAPLAEKDDIVVIGKVWRRDEERPRPPAEAPALKPATAPSVARRPAPVRTAAAQKAAAQATPSGSPVRVPQAFPPPRPVAEKRGRASQWPGVAPGPAGVPSAVAGHSAPAEIAHDERQAPLRPAAEPTGRHAARPGAPAEAPGRPAARQEGVTRQPRPDSLAVPARPPAAAWPVKDPHAPASTASPAGPAWTTPVPPGPIPPVSGARGMTAGTAVPAAADPIPAAGVPVQAAGDPVPAGPDPLLRKADSLAVPDTAVPAPPAGPAVSVPAPAAPPEPAAGTSAGPAGFFIGPVRTEAADRGPAPHDRADDHPAALVPAAHQTAARENAAAQTPAPEGVEGEAPEPEAPELGAPEPGAPEPEASGLEAAEGEAAVPERGTAQDATAQPEAVSSESADSEEAGPTARPEAASPETAEPETAEPETAEPETAEPEAAVLVTEEAPAPEASREDAAVAQPGFVPESHAPGETSAPAGADRPNTSDDLAEPDDQGAQDQDLPDEGLRDEDPSGEDGADQEPPGEAAAPAAGSPSAPVSPWSPPIVVVRGSSTARPALVERALSGPGQHRGGSNWREHVRVVPGGHGPGRPDLERRDLARVLLPIRGSRLIVVLGCTVGAGQTVTTLMLGDVLASLRAEPVAALDLNPGQTSLADMARTSPAGTARGLVAGATPNAAGQRGRGHLDLIAHDSVPDGGQALADEEYARVLEILTSRYPLTLTDPGASAVARVLSAADQLVLVAPASADAARAVAMTMEWLDGHGYGELCTGAVTVINGVSKRSMSHVEQAELVVRGRCRAIVRVPWDDHLGAPPTERGISDCLPAADAESRFAQLRPPVQHAYTALAGVLVSALAVGADSRADPPGPVPPQGTPRRWAAR